MKHSIELIVRDYELDAQGIVNNANYQHYLEHARHEFLTSKGIDFVKLHQEGQDLVVTRIEIDYKSPLKSRDRFTVSLEIEQEGMLKIVFNQQIIRVSDNKVVVNAKVTGVSLKNGRPNRPDDLLKLMK
ncbi:MAG: acyl-CoA thioesterase [Ichthyobacteriaceae bacterium]|nr:acyl-CoA thioesterase [Ichthyobacteriaceae bacterium]